MHTLHVKWNLFIITPAWLWINHFCLMQTMHTCISIDSILYRSRFLLNQWKKNNFPWKVRNGFDFSMAKAPLITDQPKRCYEVQICLSTELIYCQITGMLVAKTKTIELNRMSRKWRRYPKCVLRINFRTTANNEN